MLHGDRITQFVQVDDAFFFGRAIGIFLSVGEFQFRITIDARRHIFHHQIFGAAKNVFLRELLKLPQIRTAAFRDDLHKFKQCAEFFRAVFNRRAGQSPASSSLDGTRGFRCA